MKLNSVGFVVALHAEARALTRAAVLPETLVPLVDGCALWLSGMGQGAARRGALALADAGAQALVSFGVAGALQAGLHSGTLICPQRVLNDSGLAHATDPEWREQLHRRLHGAVLKVAFDLDLLSVSRPLLTVEEKASAHQRCSAAAVDTESAAVAAVAVELKLPFMVLRAIVDERDDPIPEALQAAIDPWGRPRPARMIAALLQNPQLLLRLPGLAVRMNKAVRSLRAAALIVPGLQPLPSAHAVVHPS
ncbi:purine and other phosphorylase-like protein, family 1 [Pseudomonas sp. NPDC090202]|uniref:phosphorylase family protein n=1 Tax=unclassified Pseudomonas TaxID=196821 RepID=UPI003801C155